MGRPVAEEDTGLKVLIEPATKDGVVVDIIAVHGLGAHPDDTWTAKRTSTSENETWISWLQEQDMLPSWVPQARIMRYGYRSAWFGPDSIRQTARTVAKRLLIALRRMRKNFPDRPLLFIAHSFGGLVVLRVLCDAFSDKTEWPGIFDCTRGLAFFGTPFRGADGMSQSEMLEAAYREYAFEDVEGGALSNMQADNEILQDLVDRFTEIWSKRARDPDSPSASIACFYELQPSEVGSVVGKLRRKQFVVTERSGCLDIFGDCKKYPIARDHFHMNKFSTPSEDFLMVAEVLQNMVLAAVTSTLTTESAVATRSSKLRLGAPTEEVELMTNLGTAYEALVIFAKITNNPGLSQMILTNFTDRFYLFDYRKAFDLHARLRFPETATWVADQSSYRDWMESRNASLMWLTGCPGVGKTIVATSLIEQLTKQSVARTYPRLLVLYSIYHEQFNNSNLSVLCTLIHQMLASDPVLQQHARIIGSSIRSEPQLWFLFHTLLARVEYDTCVIIIDGLDFTSIPLQKSFFAEIASLKPGTKVVITSRNFTRFQAALHTSNGQQLSEYILDLEQDCKSQLKKDFNMYLKSEFRNCLTFNSQSEDFYFHVTKHSELMSTFLCGKVALDRLKQGCQLQDLNIQPLSLPLELSAMYGFLIDELSERRPKDCRHILRYLLFAHDTFRVEELKFGCSLSSESQTRDGHFAFFDALKQCYPLVDVNKETGKVELTHYTAKEFLLAHLAHIRPERPLYLNPTVGEEEMALDCLKRLELVQDLEIPGIGTDIPSRYQNILEPYLQQYTLLRYSLRNWYQHLQQTMKTIRRASEISTMLRHGVDFLTAIWMDPFKRKLRYLMTLFGQADFLDGHYDRSKFNLLCALGLTPFVQEILDKKSDNLQTRKRIGTALRLAIAGGHTALAQMLISRGEITSLDGHTYKGLLVAAINKKQYDMIDIMLKMRQHTADEIGEANRAIFSLGDQNALNILRQNSAFHSRAQWKATVLHEEFTIGRSNEGHSQENRYAGQARVKFLVEGEKVDVNAREQTMGNTALHLACLYGYSADMVRALIEVGADAKKENRYGWLPLHIASLYSPESRTIDYLLHAGGDASVGMLTPCGNSALHWAAQNSVGWNRGLNEIGKQVHIMKSLLRAGADPRLPNNLGETPLSIASWSIDGRATLQGAYTALDGVYRYQLTDSSATQVMNDDDVDVDFSRRMISHNRRVRSFDTDVDDMIGPDMEDLAYHFQDEDADMSISGPSQQNSRLVRYETLESVSTVEAEANQEPTVDELASRVQMHTDRWGKSPSASPSLPSPRPTKRSGRTIGGLFEGFRSLFK